MGMDDKVADIQTLFGIAERVLGSKEKASEWMKTSLADLNGDTPQDHILKDKANAFENVKNILGKIEHGIY